MFLNSPHVPSPPPLRRTTRRNVPAGKRTRAELENDDIVDEVLIGFSKPPKKKARQANADRGGAEESDVECGSGFMYLYVKDFKF